MPRDARRPMANGSAGHGRVERRSDQYRQPEPEPPETRHRPIVPEQHPQNWK